jgi:glycerophosphoryl diester phosphodiesterase
MVSSMFTTPLRTALAAGAGAIVLLMPTPATAAPQPDAARGDAAPELLVIGHRGASGYRPEHTLASYALAARMGADYIEPDLVSTKDGVLVARHENLINDTTNVADHPEFANRRTTKVVDGVSLTGWFTEDFTLAELKTLRAKERIPQLRQRNTVFNGRYTVPTFQEVLDLRERLSKELGREIGVYPETKHPTYFRSIDLPLEEPLVAALKQNKLDRRTAKVFVQSFETGNLKLLNRALKVPIVQLLSASGAPYDLVAGGSATTYADISSAAGLRKVATYADGVGPAKDQIVPRDATGRSRPATSFVQDAHAAGLLVHPYTFRAENTFLPLELRSSTVPAEYGDLFGEITQFFGLGVDGIFTDNADIGVEARDDALGAPRDR